MKSMILAGVATLTLGVAGALAQNAPASPAASSASTADNGQFIDKQTVGEFRAPKLVGVAVYDKDSKSVGKVSDLLLDKDGTVKAVVISVGGFLGIGSKYVAVPYSALQWQTEQRTAAVSTGAVQTDPLGGNAAGDMSRKSANVVTPGGVSGTTTNGMGGNAMNGSPVGATGGAAPGDQTRTVTTSPAQTEAYQGYPDRAVIDLSQAQLKSAPEFQYASNPDAPATGTAPNSTMKP